MAGRIVFVLSLALNVFVIVCANRLNRDYNKLWVQRWRAENRAKAAEAALSAANEATGDFSQVSRSTPNLDAWIEGSRARTLQAWQRSQEESTRLMNEWETRSRIDRVADDARVAADRLSEQISQQNSEMERIKSQQEDEVRRLQQQIEARRFR